jgi:polyisoprenoid-binding protein YceI
LKYAAALLTAILATGALAAEFNAVQPAGSAVTFVSRQMGVPVPGGFGKFSAQIAFDPAKPEAGKAQITVDLASIDAGSEEANDEVKGKTWFNIREYPTATFVSSGVRSLGGGRYEARGKMTIKGRSAEIVAPFTARPTGAALNVEGELPISRKQYGIGEGSWSDPSVVADEVQIRFRFTVAAGKK